MKKLIILVQEYIEKKLNKTEMEAARSKIFESSISLFKDQMGNLFTAKTFKILKKVSPDAILIEYPEIMEEKMWTALRKASIVSVVDSILPNNL